MDPAPAPAADPSAPRVEFYADPARFLEAAGAHLAADPVAVTVVATVAQRALAGPTESLPYEWWATVTDGAEGAEGAGEVVGVAMRTAPFEPYPLFLCPMPEAAALALARELYARGEHPGGGNGALPAARTFAEESVRLWGGRVEPAMETVLWELGDLAVPEGVPGEGRPATYADLGVCLEWFDDFERAAREQAGNADRAQGEIHHDPEEIRGRIDAGRIFLWERDGEVVHLTGFNPPAVGVARIGPVYTPEEHRGHGYAAAAVAEVSRRLAAAGARVTLYTDRDNPVSNHVYAKIGFRPVGESANHTILR